jgi:hypothetical protein
MAWLPNPQKCSHCGELFNGAGSFLRHRTFPWKPPQRCLTPREMRQAGMEQRERGSDKRWFTGQI